MTRLISSLIAAFLVTCTAVFYADLAHDWRDAAHKRHELWASLLEQVPGVAPDTTILFLDLQWYLSNRAVVVQGVDGLPELIRILYRQKRLYAYFLYPYSEDLSDPEGRVAVASPRGLTTRGSALRGPIPLDSLLILERVGSQLRVLNTIRVDDRKAAIRWEGVSAINSNFSLIRPRLGGRESAQFLFGISLSGCVPVNGL
jgi:hypothetical protein